MCYIFFLVYNHRSVLVLECYCQPVALPQLSHPLFLMCSSLSFLWDQRGGYTGAGDEGAARTTDCKSTTPLGSSDYFHWAD